ncbi:Cro/CI family transcriptional regulator [Azotobacter chroococcum]|uniref:Prophage Pfl 6 Cro repressor n=1 Tax=Azotobacter chroococcum NCIMB 8003 TaxID=1328314 RepID=A0A0C4WMC0_9GAMM|nr:Cro/CI family transcriptional regulator [Azotobacter chroococcum]AJE21476.1 Prophage Pfl 6 Cro repressor [Azotobacter chroococcum NCIMB 8003]
MKKFPLGEYLATEGTQQKLADALGIQQSAVSQMVRSGRNIEITVHADGQIEANEIRPIPARPKRTAA